MLALLIQLAPLALVIITVAAALKGYTFAWLAALFVLACIAAGAAIIGIYANVPRQKHLFAVGAGSLIILAAIAVSSLYFDIWSRLSTPTADVDTRLLTLQQFDDAINESVSMDLKHLPIDQVDDNDLFNTVTLISTIRDAGHWGLQTKQEAIASSWDEYSVKRNTFEDKRRAIEDVLKQIKSRESRLKTAAEQVAATSSNPASLDDYQTHIVKGRDTIVIADKDMPTEEEKTMIESYADAATDVESTISDIKADRKKLKAQTIQFYDQVKLLLKTFGPHSAEERLGEDGMGNRGERKGTR